MEAFFGFLKVLVICIAGLIALFLILLALPNSSLKEFLLRLLKPAAITAAAAAIGTDITATMPGVGEIGDLALLAGVAWSWLKFFKDFKTGTTGRTGRVPAGPDLRGL